MHAYCLPNEAADSPTTPVPLPSSKTDLSTSSPRFNAEMEKNRNIVALKKLSGLVPMKQTLNPFIVKY